MDVSVGMYDVVSVIRLLCRCKRISTRRSAAVLKFCVRAEISAKDLVL